MTQLLVYIDEAKIIDISFRNIDKTLPQRHKITVKTRSLWNFFEDGFYLL